MALADDCLPFGFCACGAPGDWLVWDKDVRVGTFSCLPHLRFVKKRHGGGPVEYME
jgi:hypothetical protein